MYINIQSYIAFGIPFTSYNLCTCIYIKGVHIFLPFLMIFCHCGSTTLYVKRLIVTNSEITIIDSNYAKLKNTYYRFTLWNLFTVHISKFNFIKIIIKLLRFYMKHSKLSTKSPTIILCVNIILFYIY